jgi:hypothetical protein
MGQLDGIVATLSASAVHAAARSHFVFAAAAADHAAPSSLHIL